MSEPEHQAKAAPRLLTEAEVRELLTRPDSEAEAWIITLRERGLIAQEPVDRLREVVADAVKKAGFITSSAATDRLTAALRRGMELAPRKELTREMVEHAVRPSVTLVSGGGGCLCEVTIDYPTIHAALRDAIEGEG